MSTTLQAPKIKTTRLIDPRIQFLLLAATVIVMLAVIIFNFSVFPETESPDANAYRLFRQGEWVSVPFTPAQAYQIFRQGEWAFTAADMTAYHLSERILVDAQTGLATYQQSERTLIDPQAGLALYVDSERTRLPILFTSYQQSEWFGQ